MRAHGFAEAEVRAHSPAWGQAQLDVINHKRRLELADLAVVTGQATAAGTGGGEAADALEQMVEQLRADDTQSTEDWITNPNAQTDMEAMRASGLLKN